MKKTDWLFHLLVCLLGVVSVAAFAPFYFFPLIWITLAIFYGVQLRFVKKGTTQREKIRAGAFSGWAFGFGMFLGGVSWIYVSLSTFGGMPPALAALATILFCAGMALYPALACAIFAGFPPKSWLLRSLFFASSWTSCEWLRGWVLTGFPWLSIGYSQSPPSPLAGFAPILGVFGVSLLTALLACFVYEFFSQLLREKWMFLQKKGGANASAKSEILSGQLQYALPFLAVGVLLAGGVYVRDIRWVEPVGKSFSVSLLQGNIPQEMKWRPEKFRETLDLYYQMIRENPAQLTVLPETAFPAFLSGMPSEYIAQLHSLAQRHQGDILFGIMQGDYQKYANAAVSMSVWGNQYYQKTHLVPFGEFVPQGFSWFMSKLSIPMSDFARGSAEQAPMDIAGQKVAVNICYEDAFGEEIIRALPEAGVLVNLSNVAWFGDSLAPAQHLQIAQMRSLETGRVMLRSTNTGMTAIIDPNGKVREVLKPFTRGVLRGQISAYQGSTPYVRWGNPPAILFSLLVLVGVIIWRRVNFYSDLKKNRQI